MYVNRRQRRKKAIVNIVAAAKQLISLIDDDEYNIESGIKVRAATMVHVVHYAEYVGSD